MPVYSTDFHFPLVGVKVFQLDTDRNTGRIRSFVANVLPTAVGGGGGAAYLGASAVRELPFLLGFRGTKSLRAPKSILGSPDFKINPR